MILNALKLVRPNPNRFFGLNLILVPKFGLSRVRFALRVKKTGLIGSGWPQIGFNPIIINPNEPDFGSGRNSNKDKFYIFDDRETHPFPLTIKFIFLISSMEALNFTKSLIICGLLRIPKKSLKSSFKTLPAKRKLTDFYKIFLLTILEIAMNHI